MREHVSVQDFEDYINSSVVGVFALADCDNSTLVGAYYFVKKFFPRIYPLVNIMESILILKITRYKYNNWKYGPPRILLNATMPVYHQYYWPYPYNPYYPIPTYYY